MMSKLSIGAQKRKNIGKENNSKNTKQTHERFGTRHSRECEWVQWHNFDMLSGLSYENVLEKGTKEGCCGNIRVWLRR